MFSFVYKKLIDSQFSGSRGIDQVAFDPLNVDWGDAPVSPLPPVTNGQPDDTVLPKCVALYNYSVSSKDIKIFKIVIQSTLTILRINFLWIFNWKKFIIKIAILFNNFIHNLSNFVF